MLTLVMKAFSLSMLFLLQYLVEVIEILEKYSKVENEKSQTIEKYIEESYWTQSNIGQIQIKVCEQARKKIGDSVLKIWI